MSEMLTERVFDVLARRESRRGFLALCGKVWLATGAALAGIKLDVAPAAAACCANPCGDCPPPGPTVHCPGTCTYTGNRTACCDNGVVHACYECSCVGGLCNCEEVVGNNC